MIVQEVYDNNPDLVRTYSDRGVMIHGGEPEGDYAEAIDPVSMNRQYTETDIPIPAREDSDEEGPEDVVENLLSEDPEISEE